MFCGSMFYGYVFYGSVFHTPLLCFWQHMCRIALAALCLLALPLLPPPLSPLPHAHADNLDALLTEGDETRQYSESSSAFRLDLGQEEAFLPVDEAYQLTVSSDNSGLQLSWIIADRYFLYGEQFRVSVNEQSVAFEKPNGIIEYDPIFEKEVEKHYHQITLNIDAAVLPETSTFDLGISSQGCADAGLCYPPYTERFVIDRGSHQVTFVSNSNEQAESSTADQPDNVSHTPVSAGFIVLMLVSALVGGTILNLMPCVLPVLSLKALSLANSHDKHHLQGLSYTAGTVSTFIVIAAVLLAIRSAGEAVGWGFQLQSPGFVTLLIFLFFIMGLSLSGVITIGSRWMNAGDGLTQGSGLQQSYFTGVLAAVVASPCTAPFMAPALGFAMTQPGWLAMGIFTALGFGMALPLLLLSSMPQLGKWLPKPGVWMHSFKQAMAFPLYLTSVWLLWVLGRQLGSDAVVLVMGGALLMIFIYWLSQQWRLLAPVAGVLVIAAALGISWGISQRSPVSTVQAESVWEPYSEQRLADLRNQGEPVFVNMTADWCITCLANEKVVLTKARLEQMQNRGIFLMKGDWTHYDSRITRLLEKYKRGGVPLYLLFPAEANAEPRVLPQILTPAGFQKQIEAI